MARSYIKSSATALIHDTVTAVHPAAGPSPHVVELSIVTASLQNIKVVILCIHLT